MCKENMEDTVKKFLSNSNLKDINWIQTMENISLSNQKILLDDTVNNPVVTRFPIKYSYQELFLKQLMKNIENQNIEIHDDIYTSYCTIMQKSAAQHEYFYKHYKIHDTIVTLKECPSFVSNGTTGLHTWEASIVLSEWCLQNLELFNNKCVLELGSGTGLCGIVISKFCKPKQTLLSDCHPKVLDLLLNNVKYNCGIEKADILNNFIENSSKIGVINLPWEEIYNDAIYMDSISMDVIIAADIIYDPKDFGILSNAFNKLFKCNKTCQIILACTIRNEETLNKFIDELEKWDWKVTEYQQPVANYFHWPPSVKVRIINVSKQF